MPDFIMKRNDTSPAIEIQLLDNSGSAVPTNGATVRFHMKRSIDDVVVIDELATIVDDATGIHRYEWIIEDTAVSGLYYAEWEVTFADSKIETFPNDRHQSISIVDDIT